MLNGHTPVLLSEMLSALSPKNGGVYVDATFGAGGYTQAILQAADCTVYAVDQDESVKIFHEKLAATFPDKTHLFIDKFSNIKKILNGLNIERVDGIVFDIGVSSMQLEDCERGFSFMKDGPLDMRMGYSLDQITAATFVNALREEEMANIIYLYGGERYSRRVAKAIVNMRKKKKINTTHELADIIRSVVPRSKKNSIDPATRTFQAIRIWVNNELEQLERGLLSASEVLNPGGKIVIVSFHSLEDRIIKQFFNKLCDKNPSHCAPHIPFKSDKEFILVNKKIIKPSEREIQSNLRSRSAKLRAICKL